jgi:hypothetical protein
MKEEITNCVQEMEDARKEMFRVAKAIVRLKNEVLGGTVKGNGITGQPSGSSPSHDGASLSPDKVSYQNSPMRDLGKFSPIEITPQTKNLNGNLFIEDKTSNGSNFSQRADK